MGRTILPLSVCIVGLLAARESDEEGCAMKTIRVIARENHQIADDTDECVALLTKAGREWR
jgi:hypothetical protein